MKVLLFGATGMVGQGVLRECLLDPEVERVLVIGRSATGQRHEKLTEDVDAILDDIDDVLETNAEDFVRAFVQKGGQ